MGQFLIAGLDFHFKLFEEVGIRWAFRVDIFLKLVDVGSKLLFLVLGLVEGLRVVEFLLLEEGLKVLELGFWFGKFLFGGFKGELKLVDLREVLLGCGLLEISKFLLVWFVDLLLFLEEGLLHDPYLLLMSNFSLIYLLLQLKYLLLCAQLILMQL